MEIVYDFKQVIWGIAIDSEDNIFVSNYENNSIDKISLNNGKFSITQRISIPSSPLGLSFSPKEELFIGTGSFEILKITKEGIISSVAGNGTSGFADGISKDAKIGFMSEIRFDENNIAYFCDYHYKYSSIRKLSSEGKVTTLCGTESGYGNGKGKEAKLNSPTGIVYNNSTKLFYITDFKNKSIRTMTQNGTVSTFCKYSDYLRTIAIDGEGKLYVSSVKGDNNEEGELYIIELNGNVKQMKQIVKGCYGLAFNRRGDLFFTSDRKLCVIRNCTKYPPNPTLIPSSLIDNLERQLALCKNEVQDLRKQLANLDNESQNIKVQLANNESEKQELNKRLIESRKENQNLKKELEDKETEKRKVEVQRKELEVQLHETKAHLQEFKQKLEIKGVFQFKIRIHLTEKELNENKSPIDAKTQSFDEDHSENEVLKWLSAIHLENLFPILKDIGVKNLEFLKFIEESDFEGINIKPLEKRILFHSIKKYKEDSEIKVLRENMNLLKSSKIVIIRKQ